MGTNLKPVAAGQTRRILHVGLPKTGTTLLQKKWLPRLPGVPYYSTEPPHRWPEQLGWIYYLNALWSRRAYMPSGFKARSNALAFAMEVRRHYLSWVSDGKSLQMQLPGPTLLSSEGLAGHVGPVNRVQAQLIRDMFGQPKIILVSRIRRKEHNPVRLARLRRSWLRRFFLSEKKHGPFSEDLNSRIMAQYSESNRLLEQKSGYDLSQFGYY